MDVFTRLLAGEAISTTDLAFKAIGKQAEKAREISNRMNSANNSNEIRTILSELIGAEVDCSTQVFTPFYTNVGFNIKLGKNIFINHSCIILDLGGVEIKDNVLIGPRVNISSETHPLDPENRRVLVPKKVIIEENVWIGAAATILPGITIGKNSIVAAGAVVTKDVPSNVIVAGVPAKITKHLDN